jgi:hypothetical protein
MINELLLERVRDRIATHNKKKNGRLTFTVEYGRGETYANGQITVYSHDDYERSSVLSGRERRMFIGSLNRDATEQDAHDTIEAAGASKITTFMLGGSTYVPVDQVVSHLPDDTDY